MRRQGFVGMMVLGLWCWAALAAGEPAAQQSALSLFEVPLHDAKREDIHAAALKTGAKPLPAKSKSTDRYDVQEIGLPAIRELEIRYSQDRFLAATYKVDNARKGHSAEEKLRKILAEKYGLPVQIEDPFGKKVERDAKRFAERAVPDGKFAWMFADGMKLTYHKPFMGYGSLSYVDSERLEALKAVIKAADERDTKEQLQGKQHAL